MTIKEIQEAAHIKFDFVAKSDDGKILFAGPIPEFYHDGGLEYVLDEEGPVDIPDCQVGEWIAAWDWFMADLCWTAGASDAPEDLARPLRRVNRTAAKARSAGAVVRPPAYIALPTLDPYRDALSSRENGTAYLQPLLDKFAEGLAYRGDKLYFYDTELDDARIIENNFDRSKDAMADFDALLLKSIYSTILAEVQDYTEDMSTNQILALINDPQFSMYTVKIYLPAFIRALGYGSNVNQGVIDAIVAKIRNFSRIAGRMRFNHGFSDIPLMQNSGYDPDENTISITSPYINKLIIRIFRASIVTDSHDRPKLKRNGKPFTLPAYSRLVRTSIASEKNQRAALIVCYVTDLIERTGNGVPHAYASTIVESIDGWMEDIQAARTTSYKNKILQRPFIRAWEILDKQTELRSHYRDIRFPTNLPTYKTMAKTLFEFPHNGKIKPADKAGTDAETQDREAKAPASA